MIVSKHQGHTIKFLRGDTGLHQRDQQVERFGRQPACLAHAFKVFRPVQFHLAIVDKGRGGGFYISGLHGLPCVVSGHAFNFDCRVT